MSELVAYRFIIGVVNLFVMLALGFIINGRLLGTLIESHQKISPYRLQKIFWTWLFLFSFFIIETSSRVLNLNSDTELLTLIGFSICGITYYIVSVYYSSFYEGDREKSGIVLFNNYLDFLGLGKIRKEQYL